MTRVKEPWNVVNPFRRNSGIMRSPPTPSMSPSHTMRRDIVPNSSKQEFLNPKSNPFLELGNKIDELINYMKGKNNVHHAIKEQVRAIKAMYNKVKEEREEISPTQSTENCEQATQTTPKMCSPEPQTKRCRDPCDDSPRVQQVKRIKNATEKQNKQIDSNVTSQGKTSIGERNSWKQVKGKKKPHIRRDRNDAMIISAKGETTYADILRELKSDPSLKVLGESVSRIRRTQKGELLLEINSKANTNVNLFRGQMEKTIGLKADIKTRSPEIIVEIRDLDEITTKEDICSAFRDQLGVQEMDEENIKHIRRAYGGTQTAKISLRPEIAHKVLEIGKVRIGWVVCRIRKTVVLRQCYRCLEYGHLATSCKNSQDRSHLCRKCGKGGHIARDCMNDPECMLCKHRKKGALDHVAGSGRCPVFREALVKNRR